MSYYLLYYFIWLGSSLARSLARSAGVRVVRASVLCGRACRASLWLALLKLFIVWLAWCGSLVRACGCAGVRVACLAARSLARALVRSLVAVGSLCGRACRWRGRSLVRSLVDVGSLKNLSNKASDKHSYLRLLYLLKRHSFPVARVCGSLCGRVGVRVACSAARSLARAVVG